MNARLFHPPAGKPGAGHEPGPAASHTRLSHRPIFLRVFFLVFQIFVTTVRKKYNVKWLSNICQVWPESPKRAQIVVVDPTDFCLLLSWFISEESFFVAGTET